MVLISFDELAAIVAAERDDALKRAAEAAFQHIRSVGPNGIIGTIEDLKYSEPTVHQSLIKTHE